MRNPILLLGCAPVPLAHYLKALAVLRIVAEQRDSGVKASWQRDRLLLHTSLEPEELVRFFCHDYIPSPVLAPWNGGSGFFPKDNDDALSAIENCRIGRLGTYRDSIAAARRELKALALTAKPDGQAKALLLQSCRNSFPEEALGWLDAVFVLGQNGAKFPPLLGTGGNDGRLEFTNNFMQRLVEVLDPTTGDPTAESERWLRSALFAEAAPGLVMKAPIGQFYPSAAGGANATSGFDAASAVNPWDFILMIEGALLFAAASVKRLESSDDGSLVYPFCVRQTGVGYASAASADEADARCEMWMPLWSNPTSLAELRSIFGEGRAQVRGRPARSGVDFAQAAVSLGVDRGLSAFQRYGFQVRNGLSYFATPLDRVIVRRNTRVDLLAEIEQWYDRLHQKAGARANPKPPASVASALNRLERRILEFCRDGGSGTMLSVLASLGAVERALATSFRWTTENYIYPLRGLSVRWLDEIDVSGEDGSIAAAFRLSAALGSVRALLGKESLWIRQHLEPVTMGSNRERAWVNWAEQSSNDVVGCGSELVSGLNAILARRLVRFEKAGAPGWLDMAARFARLDDIAVFLANGVDEDLFADLLWGIACIDQSKIAFSEPANSAGAGENKTESCCAPSAFYALLKLCHHRLGRGVEPIPLVPAILNRAMSGEGKAASELAVRRLVASGYRPLVKSLPVSVALARRTAAAMLFPISPYDFQMLKQSVTHKPIK